MTVVIRGTRKSDCLAIWLVLTIKLSGSLSLKACPARFPPFGDSPITKNVKSASDEGCQYKNGGCLPGQCCNCCAECSYWQNVEGDTAVIESHFFISAVANVAAYYPFEYQLMQMQCIRMSRSGVAQPFAAVHGKEGLEYRVRQQQQRKPRRH